LICAGVHSLSPSAVALIAAAELGAKSVAMSALANGYGRLPMPAFAAGLKKALGASHRAQNLRRRRNRPANSRCELSSGDGDFAARDCV
jgi:hypothetical protein